MRKIPTPPGGSEQWQNGWETGYEQCLIDQERDHPKGNSAPRTWQIEYPPAPPAGTRVIDKSGKVRTVTPARYLVDDEGVTWDWKDALEAFGTLTEVVETEVEAAARRLRAAGLERDLLALPSAKWGDIRIVLAHVLDGGTL
jgi:hypothetical protein